MTDTKPEKDIMLADDDIDDVEIFRMALDELQFPYELRHAANGDLLFVLLKDKIPYILFLDINMPCKDGMACIMEIRRNREFDGMPVIMYTSFLAEKYVNDTFRASANFYLSKTTIFQELVAKLKKIFALDWRDYLHYPPAGQFLLK